MLRELFSSLTCPCFTDLSSIPVLVSHPLASGTVKSWQALELGLFWLNKQLNEVLFSHFCPELEEGVLQCSWGDLGLIPGFGRSPGEGNAYPLQCSGLENSMVYSPWGCKESDMTERLSLTYSFQGGCH